MAYEAVVYSAPRIQAPAGYSMDKLVIWLAAKSDTAQDLIKPPKPDFLSS